MLTDFLYRKRIKLCAGILAFVFTISTLLYAYFLAQIQVVDNVGRCYFLVSETINVEASAHFLQWEGGAGYFLEYDAKEYVAWSVYFAEEDGLAVRVGLLPNGKETQLLSFGSGRLYFKGEQKKRVNTYLGALRSFYACLQVFGRGISLLERGTQEETKRYYTLLGRQIAFLAEEYEKSYPSFSKICKERAKELKEMGGQTLYVKDLRYLLCELSMDYVALTSAFSL